MLVITGESGSILRVVDEDTLYVSYLTFDELVGSGKPYKVCYGADGWNNILAFSAKLRVLNDEPILRLKEHDEFIMKEFISLSECFSCFKVPDFIGTVDIYFEVGEFVGFVLNNIYVYIFSENRFAYVGSAKGNIFNLGMKDNYVVAKELIAGEWVMAKWDIRYGTKWL